MDLIFYANRYKANAFELMLRLLEYARSRGVGCVFADDESRLISLDPSCWEKAFCVVAVGGDGTVLRAASAASAHQKPVLGVNMGRVGFFSEIGPDGFDGALSKLISGEYFTEDSSMIACELNGEHIGDCLNDFVIHRQELSSITHIDLEIDGDDIGDVMSDGLIIGTPSGSTAYTMSAGGPVVAPKLDCMLVTPICPHSLTVRPIVASASSVVSVRLKCTCRLNTDGRDSRILEPGDGLIFTKSDRMARFIRFEKRNVFRLIREKLK